MQVALKENIDALKEQFKTMESIQRNSVQDIPKINEDLLGKERRLEEIMSGDHGLNRLWANITEVNRQIALLTSAVTQLRTNLKSASDLINLPKTMEELQKSVATLGSTVTSVHHDVETLQTAAEEQRKRVEDLQKDLVQSPLEDLNSTVMLYVRQSDQRLHNMEATAFNLSQRVAALESAHPTSTKEDAAGLVNATHWSNESHTEAAESLKPEIREQLQLIHMLTNAPDSDKEERDDAVTSPPPLDKKKPRSLRRRQRRGLLLPRTFTLQDLEEVFRQTVQDLDGTLSRQQVERHLGRVQSLQDYDTDGDDRYSLAELKPLLGV
ncbi:hypothetical protein GDO81_017591 [Engystomops pustulosus]|uniref:EF-hand calcium-binding domain-containing protein 14 n=2 Tax=Engystomops pustulosus TaxID=76066 RepID=A0AAV7A0J1_ENGPU|nr:hypothetical protein GDO81_017591 [Engystomops pustulosus]